jgi:DNA-binding MarR family transcriptional regulator
VTPRKLRPTRRLGDAVQENGWLTDEEMAAWLPLLRVVQLLPQALDRQLREQAGIPHTYYMILAILSAQPGRQLAMTSLARLAAMSPSRLSHAVSSLEERGWVAREPCPADRRVLYAQLTGAGSAVLEEAAPGHAAEVGRLVFSRLGPDDVAALRRIARTILVELDT